MIQHPQSASIRLMVVEDERIVAMDLRNALLDLGFQVVGMCASEAEAQQQAQALRPDLVLMDVNLGRGGDGIAAARRILRELGIPIIYLTAYAGADTIERAGEVPPYGYLLKPIEVRELNAAIHTALARHRDEAFTARLEKRFRLALDAAELGVLEFRPDQATVQLDGHGVPALGGLPQGFAMPMADFFAGLPGELKGQLMALAAPGAMLRTVVRWAAADGRSAWLEIHATHIEDENRVVGVFRDVSQQVDLETRMRQAQVVFDSTADAIAILDAEDRVLSTNPAFLRLTGWGVDEVLGRRPDEFLHVRRASDPAQSMPARAAGAASHSEVACQRRDGSRFAAWEHLAEVRTEAGGLTHKVLTFSDISALRKAEGKLQHLAFHDPLTGMANRNQFEQCLQQLLAKYECEGSGFSLLFLDLDGFKTINDSLGHDQGDRLLVSLAQRLRACLRAEDFAARLGGDEFVILVPDTEHAAVQRVATKLLEVCREPVTLEHGEAVRVSASLGVASLPLHATDANELLRAADSAMYAAKEAGRNCVRYYSRELAHRNRVRLRLEQGLRKAIAGGELSLHWQPVIRLEDERTVGLEALLRWQSAELGAVSPDTFIPVAEECGLITEIGTWVLDAALAQMAAWPLARLGLSRVAINVSAQQLRAPGFTPMLVGLLQRHAVDPGLLEVEITESTLQALDQCPRRLQELRDLGVAVALDDFGTGYSSLSSLKHLPLTRLKIDKSFVHDLGGGANDRAIVRAIVELARSIHLAVTAEGVEDETQVRLLREMGVGDCQGWRFARALPADEVLPWLNAHLEGRRCAA